MPSFLFSLTTGGVAGMATNIVAQTVDPNANPVTSILSLGVAGVVAVVLWFWQRDTAKERDRFAKINEDISPVLAEVRDAIRQSNEAHKLSAEANRIAADALNHVPSQETWTRLVVALEQAEAANKRALRGD